MPLKIDAGGANRSPVLAALSVLAVSVLAGCDDPGAGQNTIGDPLRGATLIGEIGCGGCHMIPGISAATGLVGPPLKHMGERVYIAGTLQNTPENMIAWLIAPQSVRPGTAMPNMGLTDDEARDITAYLYTLR